MKEVKTKVKHKEDIKLSILNAAKTLFTEKGFEATSIRNIASEIGYSPTTIYLYYKDKNDIIYTLHQEGFDILRNKLTVLAFVENPFERLKALGKAYLKFAKEHRDYYELMFIQKEPMNFLDQDPNKEIWEGGRQIFSFIVGTISECQNMGYFNEDSPNDIALHSWGFVHGLCSLYLTTRLEKVACENFSTEPAEVLLDSAFNAYIRFVEQAKRDI
ncbi:MAG: TetR/AcrR family transcriptional regulator [Brumimicrobium sp.]|nr:TetR/AcrR family transcriptional regulator [Brumimicrobium sp.]MCO5269244.1 TetR/AcrR family transcriptional regulator [Brumimicrobium sp.]